jgi:hypothetical protein
MGLDHHDSSDSSPKTGSMQNKWIVVTVLLLALVLGIAWIATHGFDARHFFIGLGLACVIVAIGSAVSYRYRVLARQEDIVPATVTMNVVIFLCVGLVIVSVYTATPPHNWTASMIWSLAAVLSGGAVGFLFGIPRSRTGKSSILVNPAPQSSSQIPATASHDAPSGVPRDTSTPPITSTQQIMSSGDETAIEQISDWLTKIIVGVGLTNLKELPGKLNVLGRYVATSIDPSGPINTGLGLGIVIYFAVLGVITGYLLTQIFLLNLVNRQS